MSLLNEVVNEVRNKRKLYSALGIILFLTILLSLFYTTTFSGLSALPMSNGEFESEVMDIRFSGLPGQPMNNIFVNKGVGGSNDDVAVSIATDSNNNIVIAGYTSSLDFPVKDSFQTNFGGGAFDAFLAKYSYAGDLIWSTFFGGSAQETVWDLAIDLTDDSIVLTGWTSSTNFPLKNPVQPSLGGAWDIFLTKFSPTGELQFSTYYGGSEGDEGLGITISKSNEIIVAGRTSSPNFPVLNAYQNDLANTGTDGIIFSFNGSEVLFSTYFGGSNYDMIFDIDTDVDNNIYSVGMTYSSDFPLTNQTKGTIDGLNDGFISKLNNKGEVLYSSYFGGMGTDAIKNVQINSDNHLILSGDTNSSSFPGVLAEYGQLNDNSIFLVDLNLNSGNISSILFGGSSEDRVQSLIISDENDIYLSGISSSANFPTQRAEHEIYDGGNFDIFVSKFSTDLSLRTSTYFGGNLEDQALAIGLNYRGDLLLAGFSDSTSTNFLSTTNRGEKDAFILVKGDIDDRDNDSLPKFWEDSMGLNDYFLHDKHSDLDSDQISNYDEYLYGLNASDHKDAFIDFDHDLLPTYYELEMGFNAFSHIDTYIDTDQDTLTNIDEYNFRLDAKNSLDALYDLDEDGLTTAEEIRLGTDPRNFDTDNDFFSDGFENAFSDILGSPLNHNDNVVTRTLLISIIIFSLLIISSMLFSLSRQKIHQYEINKLNEISEAKNNLVDLLFQLEEINLSLEDMEKKIPEVDSQDKLVKFQMELDSYTGPHHDLELQVKKFSKFSKNHDLKEFFEKIEHQQTRFKNLYSKQKVTLNYVVKNFRNNEPEAPITTDDNFCFYCGAIIDLATGTCNYCLQELIYCLICTKNINFGEEIGVCNNCSHSFHYGHFAETVKIMGKCPVCRSRLTVTDIEQSLPFKNIK
ncbi:MAG: SBBP repeat-containing protein [Candidatus Hodarchaeales archaeon]